MLTGLALRAAHVRWHFWTWVDDRADSLAHRAWSRQHNAFLSLNERLHPAPPSPDDEAAVFAQRRRDIAMAEQLADEHALLGGVPGPRTHATNEPPVGWQWP